MLSWNFLSDLNAAKHLSSFNICWQKFPQCWVSFGDLTPEEYLRPESKSLSLMMNLTKFTWPCSPTVGPKVVQGTTLMHANNWLQNDMDVARQSFPDHMSMVEWLLTWLTENRKASFLKKFFSLYIYKYSYRKFQFGSKLKVDGGWTTKLLSQGVELNYLTNIRVAQGRY